MSDPPGEQKGVASAPTPTAPNRAASVAGKPNSPRHYTLKRSPVKPREADAEPRASEAGAATAVPLSAGERVYLELCRSQTGRELPLDVQERRNEERRLLLAQSYRIANALESQGIPAFGPSNLSLVGVLSGEVIELPDFRNIVFIPCVAQRKRHAMLKHLEYFMQEHPFSRMWVFTSGPRVTLHEVRECIGQLHRRLSKLNSQPFLKAAGIEIVFRSTELGEIVRHEAGEPTFHVHAHVIVHLRRKLPASQWSEVLGAVRRWWKFHFKDAQRIHQTREACKYVVKPGELEQLSDPELAVLHHQLFKLHLVQCLGALQEQRQKIEETKCRLVMLHDGLASHWQIVPNWNGSRAKKPEEERAAQVFDGPPEDWIVCTLAPSFAVSNRAEPLAVVLNYNGKRLPENRRIKMLREQCGPQYAQGPT